MKKEKSLMYKSLTQFICCVSVLLVLSIPLFLPADKELLRRRYDRHHRGGAERTACSGD